jgi:hypothetical protein
MLSGSVVEAGTMGAAGTLNAAIGADIIAAKIKSVSLQNAVIGRDQI